MKNINICNKFYSKNNGISIENLIKIIIQLFVNKFNTKVILSNNYAL